MKPKHIIICALILCVLIVIIAAKSLFAPKPAGEIKSVEICSGLDTGTIEKLKLFAGDAEKEAVELSKKNGNWVVSSKFDAPAQEDQIKTLLQDMKSLNGELRSDSADLFKEFMISDNEAIHVAAYGAGDTLVRHLIVGKESSDSSTVFVRLSGETKTYAVGKNIRNSLGFFQQATGREKDEIKPERWIDMQIFRKLNTSDITRISLSSPGRRLIFDAKQQSDEQPKKDDKSGASPCPTPCDAGCKDGKEKSSAPKAEWSLSTDCPSVPFKVKQNGIEQLLKEFENLRASGIEDPSKEKECGFDNPVYTAIFTLKDKTEKKLLISKPSEVNKEMHFAKIEGEKLIWEIPAWSLNNIFSAGKNLFEIDVFKINRSNLNSIKLSDQMKEIIIKKDENGAWTIASPQTQLDLRDKSIDSFFEKWEKLEPEDIINLKETADFSNPACVAELTRTDGSILKVTVGAQVLSQDRKKYFMFSDCDQIFTINDYAVTNLFPPLTSFFTVKLLDCDRNKVESVLFSRSDIELTMVKSGKDNSSYKSNLFGYDFPVIPGAITEIINNLTSLTPLDFSDKTDNEKSGLGTPYFTATFKLSKGNDLTLKVGKKTEKGYFAQTSDLPYLFILPERINKVIDKSITDILTMRLFDFPPLAVRKVTLKSQGNEISLEQNQQGDWIATPAPEGKKVKKELVIALIGNFTNLSVSNITALQPSKETGLENPDKIITVSAGDKTYTLSVGAVVPDKKGLLFAKIEGKEGLLQIDSSAVMPLFPETGTLFSDTEPSQPPPK